MIINYRDISISFELDWIYEQKTCNNFNDNQMLQI